MKYEGSNGSGGDQQLTAFALEEADPRARARIAEAELADEPVPELSTQQREQNRAAAEASDAPVVRQRKPLLRQPLVLASAASLLVLGGMFTLGRFDEPAVGGGPFTEPVIEVPIEQLAVVDGPAPAHAGKRASGNQPAVLGRYRGPGDSVAPARLRGLGYLGGSDGFVLHDSLDQVGPVEDWNREGYDSITENPFLSPGQSPLSTFSIDVDTASYANVRRFLQGGSLPPADAVRIEELVNYFPYDYAGPRGAEPFAVHAEVAACPWKPRHRLVRIGIQAERLDASDRAPSNLVFLLDVSGSMDSPNKLPLLKSAMALLVNELDERDRVAIVVYAGASGLVLPSTSCDAKESILQAIERLGAGGSTNGGAGIELAYRVALENFLEGGTNRVLLATDGDFNVGVSSDGALESLIEEKRRSGVFLSVLGFGMGNLQDAKLEKLSGKGNGNYAYIDSELEARKVLVEGLGGTLQTVAKDVKIQVEFNPVEVAAYRLLGYENRMLAARDFNDDTKDAGEIGAGHSVTALYEVVPSGVETPVAAGASVDALRYQSTPIAAGSAFSGELMLLKLRHKRPDGDTSELLSFPVHDRGQGFFESSDDTRFAASVAAFGMLLRDSPSRGSASFDDVAAWATESLGQDRGGYRAGFLELVAVARELAERDR